MAIPSVHEFLGDKLLTLDAHLKDFLEQGLDKNMKSHVPTP